jgi:hypothetical protein
MKYARAKPRPFDRDWLDRCRLATKVLSDIQDAWLRSGDPFPARQTATVLLHIFSLSLRDALQGELWSRPVATWLSSVESPECECVKFRQGRRGGEVEATLGRLVGYLTAVGERWVVSLNNPASDEVVQGFLTHMAADGLVTLHYG